jgi:hypothetical protein
MVQRPQPGWTSSYSFSVLSSCASAIVRVGFFAQFSSAVVRVSVPSDFHSFLWFMFPFRKSRHTTIFPTYFHRSAAGSRSLSRLLFVMAPSSCLGCARDFPARVSGLQSSRSRRFCFIRSPAQGFSPVIDSLPLPLISFHRSSFVRVLSAQHRSELKLPPLWLGFRFWLFCSLFQCCCHLVFLVFGHSPVLHQCDSLASQVHRFLFEFFICVWIVAGECWYCS